jgi:DNA-binding NtrC family response regulator
MTGRATKDGTETLIRDQSSTARAPIAARIVVDGDASRQIVLREGTCRIGTSSDCDLVLDDPTVSRFHVELSLTERGVAVVDLGSRNGTFYLEQRVEKMVLGLGSRLQVGRATISLEPDDADLKTTVDYPGQNYGRILGRSAPMKQLFARMLRLEGSLVPVLVEGESGVGKELVANALHDRSKVGAGPFVAVNCGALARELILSELFGHKRGAFTGAHDARKGAFEIADGGTLFLDEIGELPLDVQPVLLRALETSEIRPLGSETTKKVQVRIVAATHRDLAADVAAGRFRQDLFYRLAVVRLSIPPLRARLEDVPFLAADFARSAGIGELDASLIEKIKARPLAGNVRELRNLILAYGALGELPAPGELRVDLLEGALVELVDLHKSYADQKDALVDRFTRIYLRTLLAHASGNQTLAARLANLDRGYLGRLIAKYDLFRQ